MILEGRTKEPIPRSAAFYSPCWSGKVTVVALCAPRTSTADCPSTAASLPFPFLWDVALKFNKSIQDAAPGCRSRRTHSSKPRWEEPSPSWAWAQPSRESKAAALCSVDDPALCCFVYHWFSLELGGGKCWPQEKLLLLCLSQQLCRTKLKWWNTFCVKSAFSFVFFGC